MASRRKPYKPKVKTRSAEEVFNEFIKDLLSGTIKATKLVVGGSKNKPQLEYDDPNG